MHQRIGVDDEDHKGRQSKKGDERRFDIEEGQFDGTLQQKIVMGDSARRDRDVVDLAEEHVAGRRELGGERRRVGAHRRLEVADPRQQPVADGRADVGRREVGHLLDGLAQVGGLDLASQLEQAATERLAEAAALSRLADPEPMRIVEPALALGRGARLRSRSLMQPWAWLGIALIAVAAVFGWQQWQAFRQVQDAEEIDAQLLSSDLPIDAYLDRGFQNWLKTSFDH